MKTVFLFFFPLVFISCSNSVEPTLITTAIEGYVLDESTGEPLDSARVYIFEIYCRNFNDCGWKIVTETISDSQGSYTLMTNIEKDEYRYYVGASKPGYISIAGYSGNKIQVAFLESQRIDVRLKKI